MLMLALKQFYIFKFIINRKPPSLLSSFTRPHSVKNSSPSRFGLCVQVIRLYSGGLMTENRNSGGFLILHDHARYMRLCCHLVGSLSIIDEGPFMKTLFETAILTTIANNLNLKENINSIFACSAFCLIQ